MNHKIFTHMEGENPTSMAHSAAAALSGIIPVLAAEDPDYVVVIGDRYEVLPIALAASYMNIRIVHTMGGEVTGTLDESVRHAITKLSHLHFAATREAANRIISMGEDPRTVHWVGCPRIDIAREIAGRFNPENVHLDGVGSSINLEEPFILVSQHPVTTEYELAGLQMKQTLEAISAIGLPSIVLWPNSDAGGADISKSLRIWRESHPETNLRFVKNLPAETYMGLMSIAACLVGNSSSGLREGSFLGTPVVNIGSRQQSRECAENVIQAEYSVESIRGAIENALDAGKSEPSSLYGTGNSGQRIAQVLAQDHFPSLQKCFIDN